MKYKPKFIKAKRHLPQRKSIRLAGYDYSQEGMYFITICCKNMRSLFGHIENKTMILNDAGKIAELCWQEIPKHFPNAILHQHIIMPNHMHGIIQFVRANQYSPTSDHDPLSDPDPAKTHPPHDTKNQYLHDNDLRAKNFSPLRPRSPSKTIGSVVRGFKIGVTKWMRQNTRIVDVWHRNYYEHIIRNEQSYRNISNYIINNPAKWAKDKFHH